MAPKTQRRSQSTNNHTPTSLPVAAKSIPFMVIVTLEKSYNNTPGSAATTQVREISEEARQNSPAFKVSVPTAAQVERTFDGLIFQNIATGKIRLDTEFIPLESPEGVLARCRGIIADIIKQAERRKWTVRSAVGPEGRQFNLDECRNSAAYTGDAKTAFFILPEDWQAEFKVDIFGLDPQIRLSWDSFMSCMNSGYAKRSHLLYYGQPGCGKTSVCNRIHDIAIRHSPPGAVMRLTASQTTKAGLENLIIKANPKPSLIIIEEIDKTAESNVGCLLDICNTDGCIRKNTANDNVNIPMHSLVLCTVNNIVKFRGMLDGALASRFAHKIFFPRPNQDVLKLIGRKEVQQYNGQMDWVERALAIMAGENTDDPRRLRAILDAGHRLMTGTYAKDMDEMRNQLIEESERLTEQREKKLKLDDSLRLDD